MGHVKQLAMQRRGSVANPLFGRSRDPARQARRVIGWQWKAPGLTKEEEARTVLAAAGDRLLYRAWEAVKKPGALARVVAGDDHELIAVLLDIQENDLPSDDDVAARRREWAAEKGRRAHQAAAAQLLHEATGLEPVMTGRFSHFDGDYPAAPAGTHVCRSHWIAKGEGERITGLARVRFELWRPYTTNKGTVIHCKQCEHERIRTFCEQIEAISNHYDSPEDLRYLVIPDADHSKLTSAIWQERARHNRDITHSSFPAVGGRTLVLHDAAALDWTSKDRRRKWVSKLLDDSHQLPTDCADLFDLIRQWHAPPKGRRSGHGLENWSLWGPSSNRPKMDRPEQEDEDGATGGGHQGQGEDVAGDKKNGGRFHVVGVHYARVAQLVSKHLDTRPGLRGMRFQDLEAAEFLNLLATAGIEYAIEGDLPECVRLSTCSSDHICTNPYNPSSVGPPDEPAPLSPVLFPGEKGGAP